MLNILHINTLDKGGAANACIRLHKGLLSQGVGSKLLLNKKFSSSIESSHVYNQQTLHFSTKVKLKISKLFSLFGLPSTPEKDIIEPYNNELQGRPPGYDYFSQPFSPYDLEKHPLVKQADIINLHWVAEFIDYPGFFASVKKPVVWTLHDMNAFTGGCHYNGSCQNYMTTCMHCPQLPSKNSSYLAKEIQNTKNNCYKYLNIHVVTPSKWLQLCSKNSLLFCNKPHECIPYGIDTEIFKLLDRQCCREIFQIPEHKKVLLFVAEATSNKRKGLNILLNSLKSLENSDDVLLISVGKELEEKVPNLMQVGYVHDERLMAVLYNLADVFVIPSLEDNLPNTVIESLCCGTPAIGFNIGGIPDMIIPGSNGEICTATTEKQLSSTIKKMLGSLTKYDRKSISIEAKAKFNLEKQANSYIKLYQTILA